MRHSDLNNERRALYGFQHGYTNYKGWFNAIFQPYSIYPYLNLLREETRELLYKKTLFKKLVPVFSKNLRVSGLLNSLIGVDFIKDKKAGLGFIEELAQVIFEDIESRQGLEDKIQKAEKKLIKNERLFSGLSYEIHDYETNPILKAKDRSAGGKLIAVQGILNSIDAVAGYNPALYESYQGSGINWILSDFPYFSMRPNNKSYNGTVLGLRFEKQVEELITGSAPFKRDLGWYPYVNIFGYLQNSLSPKHPNIQIVDWSWMQFRLPKSFDEIQPLLNLVLTDQNSSENAFLPWLDVNNSYDLFLYLSAIHLVYGSQGLSFDLVRDDIKELAKVVISHLEEEMPEILSTFYEHPSNT